MLESSSLATPSIREAAVKLLNIRSPLPVRAKRKGGHGSGHWARVLLYGLTQKHAIIKPAAHKHEETVPLEQVHLWKSAICSGHSPVCSTEFFNKLIPNFEDNSMGLLQPTKDTLIKNVIMDTISLIFYSGSPVGRENPFVADLQSAKLYDNTEITGARRSIGKIRVSEWMKDLVSEEGKNLEVITVQKAIELLRDAATDKQDPVSDKDQANLAAESAARASNGHRPVFPANGNGHGNEPSNNLFSSRISDLLPSDHPAQVAGIQSPSSFVIQISEAEAKYQRAILNLKEAHEMVTDALVELEKADRERNMAIKFSHEVDQKARNEAIQMITTALNRNGDAPQGKPCGFHSVQ
jgi:hypothetical protein